eukprot:gb/GFBE01013558.1/.p1 GENE.gb/GFBE01013558.1/~~gb/GFBE01013558.1/.p1  ORF type:complete len:380 (+),score=56.54 gb/GFBE01013558.1/:1-1140(+)
MPTENSTYLKNRASVLFGRPTFGNSAGSKDGKSPPPAESCFDGCFAAFLGYPPAGGSRGGSIVYNEKKALGPLPAARQWEDLAKDKRHGIDIQVSSVAKETVQGWINQDSAMACLPSGCAGAGGKGSLFLFGVFDGHGRYGHDVSDIARSRMPGHLSSQPVHPSESPSKALEAAFRCTDEDIFAKMGPDVEYSGSTGVVVLMDQGKNLLTIGNVGDSRAILGQCSADSRSPRWSALPLTTDLKPDIPEEKERIELSGGIVAQYRDESGHQAGPYRVWDSMTQEKPGLAVSRSLGDGAARILGVDAKPVVTSHQLRPQDRFLIIATDGLWDSIGNDEAVRIVAKFLHMPEVALKALTEAVRREEGDELVDDTTILLAIFP